jgi:hypothetical protein
VAERAADDFAAIRAVMMRLKFERHGCNLRKGLISTQCWCYRAGPQGETLPCPPPPESDRPDDVYFG